MAGCEKHGDTQGRNSGMRKEGRNEGGREEEGKQIRWREGWVEGRERMWKEGIRGRPFTQELTFY